MVSDTEIEQIRLQTATRIFELLENYENRYGISIPIKAYIDLKYKIFKVKRE